ELGPLLLALDDLHVHADRVAGGESRPVLLELYGLDQSNRVHDRIPFRRSQFAGPSSCSGVSPRSNRSTSLRSSSVSGAVASRSGRSRHVSQMACTRRHRAMRAGSPEGSTPGTWAP